MKCSVVAESWPIAGSFTISRGSKTSAETLLVTLEDGGHIGRGECVPYARYNETIDQTLRALDHAKTRIENGLPRTGIASLSLPKSAANALDSAFWDLEAKRSNTPVWKMAGRPEPAPVTTAYTLSLDTPENMAVKAANEKHRPLLKIKLGGKGDADRLRSIRKSAPGCKLIVDANEGWNPANLNDMLKVCEEVGVTLVEQPLPANDDDALRNVKSKVLICADESVHGLDSLNALKGKYTAVNIKLDKTGGLTPAIELVTAAKQAGFKIMIGCMLGTSLAMAPAVLLAQIADVVDLDGPLLLARDRSPALQYSGSLILPPPRELWG